MYDLRPYQLQSKTLTYRLIKSGIKRIINWLPTGTGKGLLMSSYCEDVVKKGKKVIVVMRRRALITQTLTNFQKYHGHHSSVIMGTHKGYLHWHFIQICSIDTIRNKMKLTDYEYLREFDVIIVDECHDTNSATYQKFFEWLGDKIFIGFTATPFTMGGKPLLFWQECVQSITADEAQQAGFLVKDIYWMPESQIITKDIKILASGDFDLHELAKRAKESVIIGDIVEDWKLYGENQPTLLFCVDKDHSMMMAAAFNQAGIPAFHMDESTTDKERVEALRKLKDGELKIVCNIETCTTGLDEPIIGCISICRPTWSESLIVQIWGRGLRPYKVCICGNEYGAEKNCWKCGSDECSYTKPYCIFLDHGGNSKRHGFPFDKRYAKLMAKTEWQEKKKGKGQDDQENIRAIQCECFRAYDSSLPACPYCFMERKIEAGTEIKHIAGKMVLVNEEMQRIIKLNRCMSVYQFNKKREKAYGWKENRIWFVLYGVLGDMMFQFKKELMMDDHVEYMVKKAKHNGVE